MSIVVVFGATGYAGGHITRELLDRGHRVVGVARDAASLDARAGLTATSGSLFDESFVSQTVKGADAVVVAVRAASGELPDAVPAILRTVGAAGARLGVVGGAASLLTEEGGPRVFDDGFPEAAIPEASGQLRVLEALKTSSTDVDWFYVSPAKAFGSFNPGERTGSYRVGGDIAVTDAEGKSFISGPDFAIAFVDELEKPAHHKVRFTVGY